MSILNRLERTNRATLAVLGIVLAVVLFLGINMIASLSLQTQRLDLTQDKLFTVTGTTRKELAAIKEPLVLHVYETPELIESVPQLRVYAGRVNEILKTYQQLSGGKLKVDRVNTVPFSPEEDKAIGYGLRGISLNRTGEQGYFGLVGTNSVDDLQIIPFLTPDREPFLEYDLTGIVHRLAETRKPRVAIVDGLGMFGDQQQKAPPSALIGLLNKNFDIRHVFPSAGGLPDGADMVMVVHPFQLSPRTIYAIDQFALKGGPVMVFIDPLAENSYPNPQRQQEPLFPTSTLDQLTKAWGLEMVANKVVGNRDMAIRITGQAGPQRVVADYVPWLQVRRDSFNPTDVVTSQLQLMRMSTAGALQPLPGATTTFTPLIKTTPNSMLFDEKEIQGRPSPNQLLAEFKSTGQPQVLAARVSGPIKTAFPDGPPPPDPKQAEDSPEKVVDPTLVPQLKQSTGAANIIVVADTDMLQDNHTVDGNGQPTSNNSDFVLNAVENLTGGSDLIGLRGRGLSFRPFTRIETMESQAETTYQATEQRLNTELQEAQDQLQQLQAQSQNGAEFRAVTEEQQKTIADANRKMLDLRQQLRGVRAALRSDVDALELQLKLANILLVPLIVILIGVAIAWWRHVRLARYLRRRPPRRAQVQASSAPVS